jgi:hypothetical protein
MNSLAPVDRDQEVRGLQILEAFPHGLSVTLTRRETLADDRVLAAEENELLHGLGLEKILSRLLTAEAALEKKARTGRFRDDALTARATVRFSPAKLPLHSEVTVEHSTIDGVTTAGSPLDSYKDRVGVKADYRFGADTLVEVSTELVDAGPTVAGDTGYKAITGEARVSITF